MVEHAPPLFKSATQSPINRDLEYSDEDEFDTRGYSYGTEPVPSREYEAYQTPAPKQITYDGPRDRKSTDKKRKRQVEELDLTLARRPSQELDEEMMDASDPSGPPILHSGLTGGLNRLMSTNKFPPSPEYSNDSTGNPSPLSPMKRKRASGITVEKTRGRTSSGQLVKVRKVRRSSDESRPRKHHRSHRHHRHDDRESGERKSSVKSIEYHPRTTSPDANGANQLVVYRTRAELFLSFVTKGPESENGYSINKALKRYHRERSEQGLGLGKQEEEKELWKSLRLKRNERGEIVVIAGDS